MKCGRQPHPNFEAGVTSLGSVNDTVGYQLARTFGSSFSCSFDVSNSTPSWPKASFPLSGEAAIGGLTERRVMHWWRPGTC
jgi:hypothetical protein